MWGELWGHPQWTRWSAAMQSVQIYSPTLWKAAYRSRGPWVTAPPLISPALASTRPVSVVVIPRPLSPPRDSHNIRVSIKCIQWSHKHDVIKCFDRDLFLFILYKDTVFRRGRGFQYVLSFFLWVAPNLHSSLPKTSAELKTPRSHNYIFKLFLRFNIRKSFP